MSRIDVVLAVLLLTLAAWFGFRAPVWQKYDPIPAGPLAATMYLLAAIGVAWLLLRLGVGQRRAASWLTRGGVLGLVVLLVAMAGARLRVAAIERDNPNPFPPRNELIAASHVDLLVPAERLNWALRVAAHALLDGEGVHLPTVIPDSWPFPRDVELAVRRVNEVELDLWARTADGEASCVTLQLTTDLLADSAARRERCAEAEEAPAGLAFASPVHGADPDPSLTTDAIRPAWIQYRADAHRSGRAEVPGSPRGTEWHVTVDAQLRATVSVSGDIVLVGAHDTGSLTALDRTTGEVRWIARAPNWIHQDPVTDGQVVIVGFGDNAASFNGRAPSGVAAWELATGRHLWTTFDDGSVMTAPVLLDSVIVYGTGSGLLVERRVDTGALLEQDTLPGFVTMAPPVAIGDTVVFGLDHGSVCAVLVPALDTLWCQEFDDLRMLGHSSPTVFGDVVTVSGVATAGTPTLEEWRTLGRSLMVRLVRSVLFPGRYDELASQVFAGVGLHDGSVRWRSPLFSDPRRVPGHTSGTAAGTDSMAVIVLPVVDTLVGFEPSTGEVHWVGNGGASRGPPLVVNDRIILATRAGAVRVLDLATGRQLCQRVGGPRYDRTGPTLAGDLVIFASRFGDVDAMPLADVLTCRDGPVGTRADLR